MTYTFKCINLIFYILIWAIFDCRHKLNQIGVRYHKLEGAKEKKRGANLCLKRKRKTKPTSPQDPHGHQSPQVHTFLSHRIAQNHYSKEL